MCGYIENKKKKKGKINEYLKMIGKVIVNKTIHCYNILTMRKIVFEMKITKN